MFSHFPTDELTAVIRGLQLRTYEPGHILFSEGEPGDSLMVLASGRVRVYVRNVTGGNAEVRQLESGAFFGEISLLSGKPRTATIIAASACEVLILDRTATDEIVAKHPQVLDTLRSIYRERQDSDEELEARTGPRTTPGKRRDLSLRTFL